MPLSTSFRRAGLVTTVAAAALTLVACSASSSPGDADPSDSQPSDSASSASLDTVTDGKLTIATGDPDYEPWFVDNDPSNGKGFEGAIANAVADELGYGDDIVWTRTSFESAIAPGPKDWDLNIQQFSVTDEREQAVDFSSPYYTTAQAVVALKGSDAASAKSLDDLADSSVGVASGTTSYTVAKEAMPDADLDLFNSNEDLALALTSGQVDALVIDLPSAFYLADARLDDGVVVGQFADTSGGDELAFVLPKDSPLTDAVSDAVDTLRDNGTLDDITDEWLSKAVDVPVLE